MDEELVKIVASFQKNSVDHYVVCPQDDSNGQFVVTLDQLDHLPIKKTKPKPPDASHHATELFQKLNPKRLSVKFPHHMQNTTPLSAEEFFCLDELKLKSMDKYMSTPPDLTSKELMDPKLIRNPLECLDLYLAAEEITEFS